MMQLHAKRRLAPRATPRCPGPCRAQADKRWQLADWRVRPLGEEALHYARSDTHFLLYCYDKLRVRE